MKIALISPPLLLTPPRGYGGLEVVVYDLGCALVKLGHDVTLFAPKGSHIDGGKTFETIVAPERVDVNWPQLESDAFKTYQDCLKEFDIIHDHSWFFFAALRKHDEKELKMVHTHHGHLDWKIDKIPPFIKPVNLIAISKYMSGEYLKQGWTSRYVYNGIDLDKYPVYKGPRENRLVFVGRITKWKGVDLAIRAARETKTPIDIIGGSFVDDPAYLEQVKKVCESSEGLLTLHLDLPHNQKLEILQRAKACLIPSQFHEPFGLTAVESLACGTTVVCLNDGALKEIVSDRSSGFVCNTADMFVNAVRVLDHHNLATSNTCRRRAEAFSREVMAGGYLQLYQDVIAGAGW